MPSTPDAGSPPPESDGSQPSASTQLQVLTRPVSSRRLLDQGHLRRLPEFLTIRYQTAGEGQVGGADKQAQVAKAIFSRINHLIPPVTYAILEYQPTGIIFDESSGVLDSSSIEIVCPTVDVCEAVREELTEISVGDVRFRGRRTARTTTFALECWGDSLPLDVLPFDVLGAQIATKDFRSFVRVLEQAMAPLGTLTGSLSIMITRCQGPEVARKVQRGARGYVKLSADSMQLNLEDLVTREPSVLQWIGAPSITYVHGHLHCYKDWCGQSSQGGRDQSTSGSSGAEANDSAEGSSKRRKTGSQ